MEGFQAAVNSDLANVFGNFINRITKFAVSKFDGEIKAGGEYGEIENELFKNILEKMALINQCHEEMEFRKAAAETRAMWVLGNEYLQTKAPVSYTHLDVYKRQRFAPITVPDDLKVDVEKALQK